MGVLEAIRQSTVIGQQSAEETAVRQQVKQMLQLRSVVRVWYCGLQGWGIVVSSRGADPNFPHEITVRTATGEEVDVPWNQVQPETDPDILKCAEQLARLWWGAQVPVSRGDAEGAENGFTLNLASGSTVAALSASAAAVRGLPSPDLVSTIPWTRTATKQPAYGHTVAIWIPSLGVTVRAYRDKGGQGAGWRYAGSGEPRYIPDGLVEAYAEIPYGPLPPPDGGAQ